MRANKHKKMMGPLMIVSIPILLYVWYVNRGIGRSRGKDHTNNLKLDNGLLNMIELAGVPEECDGCCKNSECEVPRFNSTGGIITDYECNLAMI